MVAETEVPMGPKYWLERRATAFGYANWSEVYFETLILSTEAI